MWQKIHLRDLRYMQRRNSEGKFVDFDFYIMKLSEIIQNLQEGILEIQDVDDPDVKAALFEDLITRANETQLPRLSWDFQRDAALKRGHFQWYEPRGLVKVRR